MRPNLLVPAALALGGALAAIAAYAGAPAPCGDDYVVVRHDTLYSIARRCSLTVARIAAANDLADPAVIKVGQRLILNDSSAASVPPEATPPNAQPQSTDAGSSYRIEPGDTLFSLARWARVRVPALLAANPGIDPHKIEIGDLIRLPRGAADPQPMRARERGPARAMSPVPAAPSQPMVHHGSPQPAAPPPPIVRHVPPHPAPPPTMHHEPPPPDNGDKPDEDDPSGRNQPQGM
jgi:LysM repeat protein